MQFLKNAKDNGISLRATNGLIIAITLVISAVLVFTTYHAASSFSQLTVSTDNYIALQKCAYELMEASDYLTQEAQCFTITCDLEHVQNYFAEAFETRRRENAMEKMSAMSIAQEPVERLQQAMNQSLALMEREYYAMKLVVRGMGFESCPEPLKDVRLSPEDSRLSSDEKVRRAQAMVHDQAYYEQKNIIRENMKACLKELEVNTHGRQSDAGRSMGAEFKLVRIIILLQTFSTLLAVWLSTHLGIRPLLRAVKSINEDNPLPIIGANEFRFLARAYNKMYNAYRKSIESLNYKASHDKLTGLYNRAGYDLLCSSLDLDSTAMIVVDADNFKQINDSHGHDMGDRVLQKIAAALKGNFRADDYICRTGGDEFVIFMVHVDAERREFIAKKISAINALLGNTSDGLPATSISVGVAFGTREDSAQSLYRNADAALYVRKRLGRRGCSFYGYDDPDPVE